MRTLSLLAIPALAAACSISLNFDADGEVDFAIGDIGTDCTVDEAPEGCTAVTSEGDNGECIITTTCDGLALFDVEQIRTDIDDSTNGNQNIRTQVEAVKVDATGIDFTGFTGDLPPGTTASLQVGLEPVTDDRILFSLTDADYETIRGGGEVTVVERPEDDGRWQDDFFLSELNDALDDENGELPVQAVAVITIRDVAAFQGASGAIGTLTFDAEVTGTGGVSLRAQ